MTEIAIKFENISKQYRLGMIGTGTLSHDLNRWWTMNIRGKEDPYLKIGQVNNRAAKATGDFVWALKDINLEVKQGEVLGIIGKNGAGKSTLLKILSRVTTPTTGRIIAQGRIASLLEVGTGFHPEMTGRENIFMNGSIMGMTKAEIKRKFDEIVDFAGIEKYIDTPVKRYSSGMTVRLGFAIAAHLEPEILVVDEVLAVGDAEFQKKAIGKMQDVSTQEGRTVLFVSHNMGAVANLCEKTMLMENGLVKLLGLTEDIIHSYVFSTFSLKSTWKNTNNDYYNPYFKPLSLTSVFENYKESSVFLNDERIGIIIEGEIEKLDSAFVIGIALYTSEDQLLFWSLHTDKNEAEWIKIKFGINKIVAWIPSHFLNEGDYRVELNVSLHFKEWILQPGVNAPSIQFSVSGGLSSSPHWQTKRPGLMAPHLDFNTL